ncbi:pseudoazurin [Szabonella alba]|uniref:Pseudoazurin n=1 Tax=Szabonella alba TaxID=2804194 RepID=A0A8K0Y2N9_9RHOB|nr:pseudoazurin [Szabonella alba]MBL4918484.1 pseudoazurin [Szabonella alba]
MLPILLLSVLTFAATPVMTETHIVKMLNGNHLGGMVYKPEFLTIAPGDTVRFEATQRGHNAASIDGFMPEGATPFLGSINEEIEITLTTGGFYGIKCSPHYEMGMVMLIRVGEAGLDKAELPADMPPDVEQRFAAILERAGEAAGEAE